MIIISHACPCVLLFLSCYPMFTLPSNKSLVSLEVCLVYVCVCVCGGEQQLFLSLVGVACPDIEAIYNFWVKHKCNQCGFVNQFENCLICLTLDELCSQISKAIIMCLFVYTFNKWQGKMKPWFVFLPLFLGSNSKWCPVKDSCPISSEFLLLWAQCYWSPL